MEFKLKMQQPRKYKLLRVEAKVLFKAAIKTLKIKYLQSLIQHKLIFQISLNNFSKKRIPHPQMKFKLIKMKTKINNKANAVINIAATTMI